MDTALLPFRLKTKRQRRRLLIKDRDKQLFQIEQEYEKLRDIQRNEPEVPLEEPYQRGWIRCFELIPELKNSSKAQFYQEILDWINTSQWHYDKSFKQPRRGRSWHRFKFTKLPELQKIGSYYWNYKNKLSEDQRECFRRVEYWDEQLYKWRHYYEFEHQELFEIRVKPQMVTTVKLGDALLQQEIDFLNDCLFKGELSHRWQKLKGGYYKYWRSWYYIEKEKYVNPLKNKPLYLRVDVE